MLIFMPGDGALLGEGLVALVAAVDAVSGGDVAAVDGGERLFGHLGRTGLLGQDGRRTGTQGDQFVLNHLFKFQLCSVQSCSLVGYFGGSVFVVVNFLLTLVLGLGVDDQWWRGVTGS